MKHECGVLGLYNVEDPAKKAYSALYALQHRGQESAGIFVADGNEFQGYKNFGLVREVFKEQNLNKLDQNGSKHAIGHVRYTSAKDNIVSNIQPMNFRHLRAEFAICSNGAILNFNELHTELQEQGAIFQSTSSCEILAHLLVRSPGQFLPALMESLKRFVGSYCFVVMRKNRIYAARDPLGFMPLCLGKLDDGYIVASETCALDMLGAEFIRDVEPGEIVEINEDGVFSYQFAQEEKHAFCLMEYVYFARPDSDINGMNIHQARYQSGVQLAKESAIDCDWVIGIPDSALAAAQGYATAAGLQLQHGLIKNKYSGRTFIEPTKKQRDMAVQMKLSPIRYLIEGKSVTLIDDSIVRGTTSRQIIKVVREFGAREVHMRIASPRMIGPCLYGVDTSTYEDLIASQKNVEEIREELGADSLEFLSLDGLRTALNLRQDQVCDACYTGNYPTELHDFAGSVRDPDSVGEHD